MPTSPFPANIIGKQKNTKVRPLSPLHATKFTWMTTYVQNLSPSEKAKFRKLREARRREEWMQARERLAEVSNKVFETPDLARTLMTHMLAHSDKNDVHSFLQINKASHTIGSEMLRESLQSCIHLQLCSEEDYNCALELGKFCSYEIFTLKIPASILAHFSATEEIQRIGEFFMNRELERIDQLFERCMENGFDESVFNAEYNNNNKVRDRIMEALTREYAFRLSILAMFLKLKSMNERKTIRLRMHYVTPRRTLYDDDSHVDIEYAEVNIENARQDRFLGVAAILRKAFIEKAGYIPFSLSLSMRDHAEYTSFRLTPFQELLFQYLFSSHRSFRLDLYITFYDRLLEPVDARMFERYFNCDRIITNHSVVPNHTDLHKYELHYVFVSQPYDIGDARRIWDFENDHMDEDELNEMNGH
jgi:hypothetical protein